ncbi:precorrin-3B C17-methyltransferase [Thioflavicoccus mobilis 8321]|uniref:Precorrin-3B C17-methyltransferase n=1 Tax=Thioflavicoccus mobilis 8321 TaxID=765912 RepID=L0H1U5_9GAMM|nr:precorrin-3B C(17)-methyltransferase [Thioflavicoccus mobilis]AGA92211.1 precorrin-3B C17-methyltransferase [Thioflavicoccus mobilis 8321]
MSGRLVIVGLGPGADDLRCPRASAALAAATDLVGYGPYLARVPVRTGQCRHGSDNREEADRARFAIELAATGRAVAVVSAGDAGVFGMAAAVFEVIEQGDPRWRALDVVVHPGVSAVLAAAARLGAPFGNDFCVLSLSDNLKPWGLVLERLEAAARVGLALALYNPLSKARPWQLGEALERLRAVLPGAVPVAFARAISRPDEQVAITTLAEARTEQADMRTLVVVGTAETRVIARPGREPWIYTPRSVGRRPA